MSYTNYKDSNILFVGKIPSDWIVRSMRSLFTFGRGRVISNEEIADNEGEYPVYSSQTKNDGILGYIDTYDFKGEYVTWTTDGANAGTVFYREGKFNCTNVCGTIQPKKEGIVYLKLLPYYLNFATKEYVRYDINPKLMNNVMGDIPICFPESLEEQQQIANYLDKKTAKIDATIVKNKELIELLEEKRVALINQVVTKGLNPDVAMKDSGVKWIGEIPEHWDINNLNYAASDENYSFVDGPFGSDLKNEEYVDEGIPIIQLNNIKVGYHDFTNERFITEEKYNQLKKHSIKPGHIVIAKMAEPVARGTIVSDKYERYTIVADCIKLACNNKFSNRYVTYSLNSYMYHEAVQKATGTTRVRINLQEMKKLKLLIPPLKEQNRISDYLDNETLKISKTISKIKENINLLEEFKTSLIHHVVTGKIDIRGEEL